MEAFTQTHYWVKILICFTFLISTHFWRTLSSGVGFKDSSLMYRRSVTSGNVGVYPAMRMYVKPQIMKCYQDSKETAA